MEKPAGTTKKTPNAKLLKWNWPKTEPSRVMQHDANAKKLSQGQAV